MKHLRKNTLYHHVYTMRKRGNTFLFKISLFYARFRRCFNRLELFLTLSALSFAFYFLIWHPSPCSFSPDHHPPPIDNQNEDETELDLQDYFVGSDDDVPSTGPSRLWSFRNSKFYYGCSNASDAFLPAEINTHPNRYLMIATSGGLNQQRTGIIDAVIAARILNATLVVPKLDQKSYWQDESTFSEIFDVDWFISSLSKDVKIIKQLPTTEVNETTTPYAMRVPRKCTPSFYLDVALPVLEKNHAVWLTKFDFRLTDKLGADLLKLRCRVNFHALKFTDPILEFGKQLVERMRAKSKKFVALHLRYEADMLAFSGCRYGGGEKEERELEEIRRKWWKSIHVRDPDTERRHGKCPLTPGEVGLMLSALGFGSAVHIYVASGEVYGGEESMAPLKDLFPNINSKVSLATVDELKQFSSSSSQLAALDFIVCDKSDVFVSNNNGNMARMLAGRRKYFGHKPTIRPNAKKLNLLFKNRLNMNWEEFESRVRRAQVGFMGKPKELTPGKTGFHENPSLCICEGTSGYQVTRGYEDYDDDDMENNMRKMMGGLLVEDEQDLLDTKDMENEKGIEEKDFPDRDYEEVDVGEMLPDFTQSLRPINISDSLSSFCCPYPHWQYVHVCKLFGHGRKKAIGHNILAS